MSLTFATANGMPIIVSAGRNAVRHVCERELPAEQDEPDDVSMNEPTPAVGFGTVVRANGHTANPAIRNAAIPNGIVTIRMQATTPART